MPVKERNAHPWRAARIGALLLGAVFAILFQSNVGVAHAALDTSNPASGDVVATAPTGISATFTEGLEQSYSRLQLFDSSGAEVQGTSLTFDGDGHTMSLSLPAGLPNGTYTVLWRTLSSDDGHTAENYFPFTIGSNADIVPVVIPTDLAADNSVPQWAKTISRWLALIGLAALIGCWPVWSTVIRPALAGHRDLAAPFVRRMRRFAFAATLAAVLGSVVALAVQALALSDGTFLDKIFNTLGQTRYGHLWLARVGLIIVLGLVLGACGWWFSARRQVEGAVAWVTTLAVVIPFSLIAHASAQEHGRTFAVVSDAAHLVSASVWAGGIMLWLAVVFPGLRTVSEPDRVTLLRALIPRFSTMAMICLAAVGVTGFYAGWLEVGNLHTLTSTRYGQSLIWKLVLLVIVLALAAINLLVIEKRLAHRDALGAAGPIWTRRLKWTVSGELIGIALLFAVVGQLTSLQPARDVVTAEAQQVSIEFASGDTQATLLLAPGIVGSNHFRLEVQGDALPTTTEALLRLSMPDNPNLGTKEITLSRVAGNAFEHHGSELSLTGNWTVTVIIRQPGTGQLSLENTLHVEETRSNVDVPGQPWRFATVSGVTGLLLVLLGLGSLIVGLRTGRKVTRKESIGLGLAAILLGLILVVQARIDPVIADAGSSQSIDPADIALVDRGKEVYTQQCLSCHGSELRGDGPASAGMQPPPADFSAPHTTVHSASDLIYWVRNGKQGTAMPAFGNVLSDDDIRAVLSYIASVQQSLQPGATP